MRTLSSTVKLGNRRMFWKVRPMPRRVTSKDSIPTVLMPLQPYVSAAGDIQAADHVEDGRLPCSVRTDQARQLTLPYGHREIVDGPQAAEKFRQPLDLQERCGQTGCCFSRHFQCSKVDSRKPGRLRAGILRVFLLAQTIGQNTPHEPTTVPFAGCGYPG